jgi:hypothetical protein
MKHLQSQNDIADMIVCNILDAEENGHTEMRRLILKHMPSETLKMMVQQKLFQIENASVFNQIIERISK